MLTKTIQFNALTLTVSPDSEHGWLMSTADAARGYGITPEVFSNYQHGGELLEGQHFTTAVSPNGEAPITRWTKRGVLHLGLFIGSDHAKLFRDFAESVILNVVPAVSAPDPIIQLFEAMIATRRTQLEQNTRVVQLGDTVEVLGGTFEDLCRRMSQVEQDHEQRPIDVHEACEIYELTQKLGLLIGGGSRPGFREAYRILKSRFKIASYKVLPKPLLEEAKSFLEHQIVAYTPTRIPFLPTQIACGLLI